MLLRRITLLHLRMNKGTGAGGASTNLLGKKFEELTDNEPRLLSNGFVKKITSKAKFGYHLTKRTDDSEIIFVLQSGLKEYMKSKFGIELFRCPDEAYITIPHNPGLPVKILILEKKEQNVEGSVETKLWSGPSLKREYQIVLGEDFEVIYTFCVSQFLKSKINGIEKKYTVLKQIFKESDITVLFGEDPTYFEKLDDLL
jgi:hypothetical protein